MTTKYEKVLQLKITLYQSKPPIWRRIQVPEISTFLDLHFDIQAAMGWENYHLFIFKDKLFDKKGRPRLEIGDPEMLDDNSVLDCTKERIAKYFKKKGDKMYYEYDFGDSWLHEIILEEILARDPEINYPICIAGEKACPPEDSGGYDGYMDMLEVLKNPDDPEYEEYLDWIGEDFDPKHFDPKEVRFWGDDDDDDDDYDDFDDDEDDDDFDYDDDDDDEDDDEDDDDDDEDDDDEDFFELDDENLEKIFKKLLFQAIQDRTK